MNADESLVLMTWRARPDMSCEHVSGAWLEFTGLTPESALGDGWSRGVHPEDLARWLDTYVRSFDERQAFEIEYRLRRHDGAYRWVLERAAPLYENGVFVGYVGVCTDIEEQKRRQHDLARALEREQRLRVAAEDAGRLRQGLAVSVLRELEQALRSIERSAREQGRVISNLLELAPAAAAEPLLGGVKVLVVEPDPAARDTLVRMLGIAGADVRAAASTTQALETPGAWRPDVLLSGEGDSLIRALRGSTSPRSGYDARLAKPVEPVALLATVARLAA